MRILLLCESTLSEFDQKVFTTFKESPEVSVAGALINTKLKGSSITRIKRELRKGRGGYVMIQAIQSLRRRISKNSTVVRAEHFFSESFPGVEIKLTSTLYGTAIQEWIAARKFDCIFLRGFGIIKEPILSLCKYGVLSYHHGDICKYRGGPPAFWELYNNESEIGVTMQILDKGLDTGTVVVQRFFQIDDDENWSSLRQKIYEGSTTLALEALLKLKSSGPLHHPIGPKGHLYTLPNFREWVGLQLKLLRRQMFR
jgi:folate-dependent phosphoribosylglycinamide formyltransferase PurN